MAELARRTGHVALSERLSAKAAGKASEAPSGRAEDTPAARARVAEAEELARKGEFLQAIDRLKDALTLAPDAHPAYYTLGYCLYGLGKFDEAVEAVRRAIELAPGLIDYYVSLAEMMRALGRFDEAAELCDTALSVDPKNYSAHNNLGVIRMEEGRLTEAEAHFTQAIRLAPKQSAPLANMALLASTLGQHGRAIILSRKAVEISPAHADYRNNLAHQLMAMGEYREGFTEYQWRWKTRQLAHAYRAFPQPEWTGEPLDGRTLMIHAEQGFGDTLQFVRFVPLAKAKGGRIIVEVPAPLRRLVQTVAGVDQVVITGEPLPEFDLHCPMLTLPMALGTTLETVPADIPYMTPDPADVTARGTRLDAEPEGPAVGLKVGIVWGGDSRKGNATRKAVAGLHHTDKVRSIPFGLFEPLFDVPDVTFFSLQLGDPALQRRTYSFGDKVRDPMTDIRDFADTAAVIANLDLVISVDTSVVHLAGAIGTPVWVLHRHSGCWRWLLDREDSPWYPTARIFRQQRRLEWGEVIARVADQLRLVAQGQRDLLTPAK